MNNAAIFVFSSLVSIFLKNKINAMQHSKAKNLDIKLRNTLDNTFQSQSIRKETTEYFPCVLCGYIQLVYRVSAVIHRLCEKPVENWV